jgi:hypothetical protein
MGASDEASAGADGAGSEIGMGASDEGSAGADGYGVSPDGDGDASGVKVGTTASALEEATEGSATAEDDR